MSVLRLISFKRATCYFIKQNRKNFQISKRALSKSVSEIEDEENKPITFTKSPAGKWKAELTRSGIKDERLWYEPYVILASVAVFMVYFCILREENDVDKELGRSLYSRIEGLEEQQLIQSLHYNEQHGLPTEEILKRLEEIKKE